MTKELKKAENHAVVLPAKEILGLEEGVYENELIIPRAKLMQPTSPELSENEDLRQGMVANSVTLQECPQKFIPIKKEAKWIRFNPLKSTDLGFDSNYKPGSIIWQSKDPDSPEVKSEGYFGPQGEPPLATKFLNFFVIFEGQFVPNIIGFAKTSYNAGKQLLSLARYSGENALFSRKYVLKTLKQQNDKGVYYVFKIAQAGKTSDLEYKACFSAYQDLIKKEPVIHEEESPFD